jgi:hypothetical protein
MAIGNSVLSGKHTLFFWVIAVIPFYAATWEQYVLHIDILQSFTWFNLDGTLHYSKVKRIFYHAVGTHVILSSWVEMGHVGKKLSY